MRRRQHRQQGEPPARLAVYDEGEWLPLVDPAGYDPDRHRGIRDGLPYGQPRPSLAAWRRQEASRLWARARLDWLAEHGWPGMTRVELLRDTAAARRVHP